MPSLPRRARSAFLLLLLLLLAVAFGATGGVSAQTTDGADGYGLDWDSRLDVLGVRLIPATDCSAGCYKLVVAEYQDPSQSGGRHAIYGNVSGMDARWSVTWPGGTNLYRPGENHGMWRGQPPHSWGGCYDWPTVPSGPFTAYASTNPQRSDQVAGIGLPQCQYIVVVLTWVWVPPSAATATAAPTVTPRATATRPPGGTPVPLPPTGSAAPGVVVAWEGALYICTSGTMGGTGRLLLACDPLSASRSAAGHTSLLSLPTAPRTATPTASPPGLPGGRMLVDLFMDNSVLSVGCADPSSRLVFAGVPPINPQRVEHTCVPRP